MKRLPLRLALLEATRTLDEAGVASPRTDAELIAAHVLGVERGRLPLVPLVDPPVVVMPQGTIAVPEGPGIGHEIVWRRVVKATTFEEVWKA